MPNIEHGFTPPNPYVVPQGYPSAPIEIEPYPLEYFEEENYEVPLDPSSKQFIPQNISLKLN